MNQRCLLSLLAGCTFAPTAFAGVEQTVNDLLPKLAAPNVEDRYGPQMELQSLALNAARPGADTERAQLARVLAAKAADPAVPQPARVWVVRQLEYIGGAESVAALATLLEGPDAELKECARRALEKNPDPAAGERLRAALKQAQGGNPAWKIGLMQSLGERRDTLAVEMLRRELWSEDPGHEVRLKVEASAAASALGKIADAKAVAALWEGYERRTVGAADGLIVAGDRLLSAGDKLAAKDLFLRLYRAGVVPSGAQPQSTNEPPAPVQVRSAALIGWAVADPESARGPIAEALLQKEPALQFAGATAAPVAFGKDSVSAALAPLLPRLSPTAKTYVLQVLDASAEKEVIAAAGDADEMVRLAALERLGQIGSAASIPVLFRTAVTGPASAERAATAALARISGRNAGAAIVRLAGVGDSGSRAVAMNALAARYDLSVAPALLRYAGESDPVVSAAACAALAKLGTDKELDGLIQLVLAGKTPGAGAALQAVAGRATDKSGAAQKLVAKTRTAKPLQLAPIFEVLAMLGGKEALDAVTGFAASSRDEVKDAAIRALANWTDFGAAKELLAVAADPNASRVHNALAIQAVARLVKSVDGEPTGARLSAALDAMKAARRDQERKLLLSALASVPDRRAAEAIKPYLREPQLQPDAGLAAMTLAESLRKPDRAAARDLAQAVKEANLSEELTRKADAFLRKK